METTRTVVITGGGGHLGRAVGRWWAGNVENIVLVDRDAGSLARCRDELESRGTNVVCLEADVTDAARLAMLVHALPGDFWSAPPTLVLAHGVSGRTGPSAPRLGELHHADWSETIEANLTSVVFAIQAFVPVMKAAAGGRIVLVASAAGLAASPTAALSYAVSKAGVAALPGFLAAELGADGILINAVAPGKFVNPDWPDAPEQVARYAATVPLGRLASTDEVAGLIGFLGSPANTYVTGQTILQDGGRLSGLARGGKR